MSSESAPAPLADATLGGGTRRRAPGAAQSWLDFRKAAVPGNRFIVDSSIRFTRRFGAIVLPGACYSHSFGPSSGESADGRSRGMLHGGGSRPPRCIHHVRNVSGDSAAPELVCIECIGAGGLDFGAWNVHDQAGVGGVLLEATPRGDSLGGGISGKPAQPARRRCRNWCTLWYRDICYYRFWSNWPHVGACVCYLCVMRHWPSPGWHIRWP